MGQVYLKNVDCTNCVKAVKLLYMEEKMRRVYLDYAAATPLRDEVKAAMEPYWSEHCGNAGAMHAEGMRARRALGEARESVARVLRAHSDEIIFTGSGTESNAIAIFGVIGEYERAHGYDVSGLHIVTSVIEHPSVLQGFRDLEERGARVDYLRVDTRGFIDLPQARSVITPDTTLVSAMYVNNEIGTIEPIADIAKVIRHARKESSAPFRLPVSSFRLPAFHTDASQAPLYLPLGVDMLGVDLLTIDGQKIYGPKGIGALYIRRGTPIRGIMRGGKQERSLRPGTEPIPLIVGLAKALELADKEREETCRRLTELRNYFIDEILKAIPGAELNGDKEKRLPNNVNISFPGFDNEFLIISLDERGVACASRSACIVGPDGSYVIRSLGKDSERAISSLRFSLGRDTTKEDIDYALRALVEVTRNTEASRTFIHSGVC